MNLHIFHFQPYSAFHFGVRGVGLEESLDYAASDTLFGALCSAVREVDSVAGLENLLAEYLNQAPPFLCSGAFPYLTIGDSLLRFYPAPLWFRRQPDRDLRKADWVSETLFDRFVQTGTVSVNDLVLITPLKALVTTDEYDALMRQYRGNERLWTVDDEVTRVAVDRVTSAGNVFRVGQLRFVSGGGLWCGFAGLADEQTVTWIRYLLTTLGDEGIGGERSSGYGQFALLGETIHAFPDAHVGRPFVTLSHYSPQDSELDALSGEAAYEFVIRRGWIGSPEHGGLRRKAARMIKTGSVLSGIVDGQTYGRLVPVTPDATDDTGLIQHPVYRYGFALPIGIEGG